MEEEKQAFGRIKIGIFGKQIPVVALLVILVAGLGSAALLTYFGVITTTANVEQAVTLVGGDIKHTISEPAPGGEKFCYLHELKNDASVDIDVGFETEIAGPGGCLGAIYENCISVSQNCFWNWNNGKCIEKGVTTTIYPVPENGGPVEMLTTKSRDKTPMLICYNFKVHVAPGTYTLTTDIIPQ